MFYHHYFEKSDFKLKCDYYHTCSYGSCEIKYERDAVYKIKEEYKNNFKYRYEFLCPGHKNYLIKKSKPGYKGNNHYSIKLNEKYI